jgi:hypothetical protein
MAVLQTVLTAPSSRLALQTAKSQQAVGMCVRQLTAAVRLCTHTAQCAAGRHEQLIDDEHEQGLLVTLTASSSMLVHECEGV